MASKQNGTRNAAGAGSIRKKAVTRGGKEYIYWEARYTAGYDPGTGKQVQRSITGKTQRDVAQKLREITAELDSGTYQEPSKMTVSVCHTQEQQATAYRPARPGSSSIAPAEKTANRDALDGWSGMGKLR